MSVRNHTLYTSDPAEAATVIRRSGTVAFPTETVYGLGTNAFDAVAVAKIFAAKRRPADNPLIAHIAHLDQIEQLTSEVGISARRLIGVFFPGPLTLVLRKSAAVPLIATAGLETVGVRMPRLPLAQNFLRACDTPVVAPSANLSGRPSPTTWQAVAEDLDERIDCILQGDATEIGLESTVVDCSGDSPLILRQGAVTLAELQSVVPDITLHVVTDSERAKSPGLMHRHYSPTGEVRLVDAIEFATGHRDAAYIGICGVSGSGEFGYALLCGSIREYAFSVFEFFRECDRRGISTIQCEKVERTGIGAALMDRLERAAAG
ncbi:MAG: L-threonylcarbamoyladenylate synthase [Pyrinomonadaceae bacterium]